MLSKKQWIFLFTGWFFFQMLFLFLNRINSLGESDFIATANSLAAGQWNIEPNNYLYFGNILIVLFFRLTHISYEWIYLVQLSVGAIAFICFIRLMQRFFSNPLSIMVTGLLFSACPFFQSWTVFLSSDSIFANLLIVAVYLLTIPDPSLREKKWTLFFLLVMPFFRPVGFLLVGTAIFYWITNYSGKYLRRIIFFSGYLVLLSLFCWYCLTHAAYFFYPAHNSEASIICGYPSGLTRFIKLPYDPGRSMLHFFISNPEMSWRLMIYRLFSSFWMTRPYYSDKHNLFIAAVLIPYYFFAVTGIITLWRNKIFLKNAYILFGLMAFVLPNLLFCADWVNRFMLPPLVFIFILMAYGIDFTLTTLSRIRDSKKQ
jgi:hypothetical protein